MKNIAYIRVSKNSQDTNNQKLAMHDYTHKHGIKIDKFFEYIVSSTKSSKDRGIDKLLEELKPNDKLIVSELSRLGRSVGQVIRFVDDLIKNKISFLAIKENIVLNGKQDIQSKVMITMFGLFAEIERDLISLRTKEALAAAKAKGKQLGRPKGSYKSKLDGKESEIRHYLKLGVSKASTARIMGISKTAFYSFLKSRKFN